MIWKKYDIDNDEIISWKIGTSQIFLRRKDAGLAVAKRACDLFSSNSFKNKLAIENISKDIIWDNIITDKDFSIWLLPALSLRPLLIKLDEQISILPGKFVNIYVNIPVIVRLYSGKENTQGLFFETNSVELSSTWLGSPDNGVLSYSLYSCTCFKFEDTLVNDNEVVCPVKISNESDAILKIDRFQLDVDFLRIYSDDRILVSNLTIMKYKGENAPADVQYIKRPPDFIKDLKLLSSERNTSTRNIIIRSFDFFKSVSSV